MSPGLVKGTVIGGDFRILEELAEGGMGSVYVAEQVSTGKRRALKVMQPQIVTDERSRRRFVEEAKVGARIASEHVVEVIAAGVDETLGVPWLAMELLEGTDLEAHLRAHGPLSLPELVELYEQVAHALGEAHAQGVIHRDLKPENLFLARSRRVGSKPVLKVLDFGIAAFVSSDKTAATVTTAIGSPLWVAPEQMATGAKLRPSTDVFAMGLIAFYLLTGKSYWRAAHAVPFSLNPLIAEIVVLPLPSASERTKELGVAALPPGFDAWLGRCLVREPEARFADATEAFEALAPLGVALPSTMDRLGRTDASRSPKRGRGVFCQSGANVACSPTAVARLGIHITTRMTTMNRALSTCMLLLLVTAMAPLFVGCDSGPSCVANVVPATCTPECDVIAGEFCNDGTCQALMTCDPACDTTTEFCNPLNGACENLPRTCDPSCASSEFCNDGTCELIPVCDPACGVNEQCE